MAKLYDLQVVCSRVGLDVSSAQLEAIAKSTPDINDIEKFGDELLMKDKVTIGVLKKLLYAQPKPKAEGCGKCWFPFGLPMLDIYLHKKTQNALVREYDWLAIPTVYAPCPNCSGSKRYLELYARQREDERAWTWILLYDYFIFNLQQSVAPEAFTPAEYWPGVEGGVAFSPHQRSILIKIYESSKCRENNITHPEVIITRLVQSVVKPMVMQDTIPF